MDEKNKKIIAKILLLLGVTLFIYALFGFQSDYYCGQGAEKACRFPELGGTCYKCTNPVVYYYYNNKDRALLTIGVIFIILQSIGIKKEILSSNIK